MALGLINEPEEIRLNGRSLPIGFYVWNSVWLEIKFSELPVDITIILIDENFDSFQLFSNESVT